MFFWNLKSFLINQNVMGMNYGTDIRTARSPNCFPRLLAENSFPYFPWLYVLQTHLCYLYVDWVLQNFPVNDVDQHWDVAKNRHQHNRYNVLGQMLPSRYSSHVNSVNMRWTYGKISFMRQCYNHQNWCA